MALPTIEFVAPEIRAAILQLQTYMPGQAAAFNADARNSIDIEAPATYHFGGQDLLNAYAFPQVEVAAVTGDTGEFAIGRTRADHDPRVNVAIWLQGSEGDIPHLYEQTVGMVKCVIECLAPVGAFGPGIEISNQGGIVWRIDVLPNDPTATSPNEGRDFQKWLGSGLVQFHLEAVEHFT